MTPARILIVEDDRIVTMDIQQQLNRIGHSVVASTTRGEDVLAIASDTAPNLILMDIMLAGRMDGIEAANQIRQRFAIPIIFLTAYADDRTVERASVTEPFGYLLKPFEDSQLRTAIEMALFKHAAERKLVASERRFSTTLSSIGDAVIATDGDAKVTFMNPIAERLTGWSISEAAGRPLAEVFHILDEATRTPVEYPSSSLLGCDEISWLPSNKLLVSRLGQAYPIENSHSQINDDSGAITGAVLVFRNISERRNMEEALRQAQTDLVRAIQLTSMSELAALIANDINQPLTAAAVNAEACTIWLGKESENLERAQLAAQNVVTNCHLASNVVQSILKLMRKPTPDMKPVDMNGVIRDILDLVRSDLRRQRISLEINLPHESIVILGDRIQLQQVIVNLILNGIESIGISSQRRILRVSAKLDDRDVSIFVEDSGMGLVSDSIFDPISAAKRGSGGVSLLICRTIVEAHKGRLWAYAGKQCGRVLGFALPLFSAGGTSGGLGS